VGGIIPGYETARHLGVPSMYVEREGGEFKLRRGFSIEPGARVVMVEDIVTTGLSSRECIAAIRAAGGNVVAAACIVDRSAGRADVGVPLIALASLDVPAYPADALPPELAAIPIEDPGSRRLSAKT
jgi:orotate phosphoribosyltransferase